MAHLECTHESDVIMFVATGRWPERAPAELRAHADQCEVCGPLGVAASAIEAEAALPPPALPSAGQVWWRAQLRARQEAARVVVRPMTVAQAAGVAVIVGVAGAVFGATASWFQGGLRTLWRATVSLAGAVRLPSLPVMPAMPEDLSSVWVGYRVLLVGILVSLMAAAVIIRWATKEDRRPDL